MAGKVISIEIGYSLTRVCEVDYKKKSHKVYAHFTIPTPEGVINDGMLTLSEEYISALRDAITSNKMKAKQVIFALTSTKIASREVLIPFVKENRIMDVVNANASDYFPVDLSKYQLSYMMLGTQGDAKTEQQYKLLVLAAPLMLLKGYQDLATALKLELVALDYAGNSAYQVAKGECADKVQMIVKIEESATMVMVVNHSVLSFIRSVSYGVEDAFQTLYQMPLRTPVENVNQAVELLRTRRIRLPKNEVTDFNYDTKEKTEDEVFSEAMVEALTPLIGAISRVVDYYVSNNADAPIEKILLTGLGADMEVTGQLLEKQLDYPIEVLNHAEGWQLEKSFQQSAFSEYVASAGAAAAPLGFFKEGEKRKGKEKDKGTNGKLSGLFLAIGVLVLGVIVAVVLCIVAGVQYFTVNAENVEKKHTAESLREIIPIYEEYVSTKEAHHSLTAMHNATQNRNDDLHAFMEELERKMPSNGLIESFTSDSETVTITMSVTSKAEAASMIEQFRTFESLLPDSVSVSSINAEVDGEDTVLAYKFTIVGTYRDMDDVPGDEEVPTEGGEQVPEEQLENMSEDSGQEFAMNR